MFEWLGIIYTGFAAIIGIVWFSVRIYEMLTYMVQEKIIPFLGRCNKVREIKPEANYKWMAAGPIFIAKSRSKTGGYWNTPFSIALVWQKKENN